MIECLTSDNETSFIDWRQEREYANGNYQVHPDGECLSMLLTLDNVTCSMTVYFYAVTRSDNIGNATTKNISECTRRVCVFEGTLPLSMGLGTSSTTIVNGHGDKLYCN